MAGARGPHAPPPLRGPRPHPAPDTPPEIAPRHLRMRRQTCPSPVSLSLSLSLLASLPLSLTLSLPFSLSRRYVHPCSLSIPAPLLSWRYLRPWSLIGKTTTDVIANN